MPLTENASLAAESAASSRARNFNFTHAAGASMQDISARRASFCVTETQRLLVRGVELPSLGADDGLGGRGPTGPAGAVGTGPTGRDGPRGPTGGYPAFTDFSVPRDLVVARNVTVGARVSITDAALTSSVPFLSAGSTCYVAAPLRDAPSPRPPQILDGTTAIGDLTVDYHSANGFRISWSPANEFLELQLVSIRLRWWDTPLSCITCWNRLGDLPQMSLTTDTAGEEIVIQFRNPINARVRAESVRPGISGLVIMPSP